MSVDPSRKQLVAPSQDIGFEGFGEALGELLSNTIFGIGQAISDGLNGIFGGIFAPVNRAMKPVRDGQLDLNDRADLISTLLDYGSVSMPAGQPFQGTGTLPFSEQIGAMRGVEKFRYNGGSHSLRLLDKGLWDIRLHTVASWVVSLTSTTRVDIVVYRPDGSEYSRQSSLDTRTYAAGGVVPNSGEHTHSVISSVVVPEPGYFVEAQVNINAGARKFLGGPQWSRLVAQHISRETEGNWNDGTGGSDVVEK